MVSVFTRGRRHTLVSFFGSSRVARPTAWLALGVALALGACVPEGPKTDARAEAKSQRERASKAAAAVPLRPSGKAAGAGALAVIDEPYEDRFERAELGPDWSALSPAWRIEGGRLCAKGARNKGAWLLRRLPTDARIELDAVAQSADGDLKLELWGDGKSGATKASYSDATSYVLILGGWKNSKHVLARLDEHGDDRLQLDVEPGSDDERARPIEVGQTYHLVIERTDGKTVRVHVQGLPYFDLVDPAPLVGEGHEHLGLNEWEAPVCFDNLRITPLGASDGPPR